MSVFTADRAMTLASLGSAPNLVRALVRDLTPGEAMTAPRAGEWSITEVVRHLLEGERDTFVPRLRRMLAESRPVFAKTARDGNDTTDLKTLLDAWVHSRTQSTGILAGLDEAAWQREGVSPSRGLVSIDAYAITMAEHDTEHLGQIEDVRTTLGLVPRRCEARRALDRDALIAELEAAPRMLAKTVEGLTTEQWQRRPRDGEWCLNEVMAHLSELESRLFLPRFRLMATEDRPAFAAFDVAGWERERDRRREPFDRSLAEFTRARGATIDFLAALAPAALSRVGVSGFFGPMTLAQYATHAADHDREHLGQMAALRP
jgi:uncharacterized damage-inducible protein DinB